MSLHLLPRYGESTLCRVAPGCIHDLYPVPAPPCSPYAVSHNEDWLAFFTNRNDPSIRKVTPHDRVNIPLSLLSLQPAPSLLPPEPKRVEIQCSRFRPYSFLFQQRRLYIGGSHDFSCLGFIDMDDRELNFQPIDLPRTYTMGKAIDAILIDQGRLLAIDNLIMPMYVWVYDIASQPNPTFVQEAELGMEINLHVITACKHQDYFTVLSGTSSFYYGSNIGVSCYKLQTLEFVGSQAVKEWSFSPAEPLQSKAPAPRGPGRYTLDRPASIKQKHETYTWQDMTIFNNYLMLAAVENGVGMLPFSKYLAFSQEHLPRYVQVPGFTEVYRVIGLEESDSVIIVGKSDLVDGKFHSEIFSMDHLFELPSAMQSAESTTLRGSA